MSDIKTMKHVPYRNNRANTICCELDQKFEHQIPSEEQLIKLINGSYTDYRKVCTYISEMFFVGVKWTCLKSTIIEKCNNKFYELLGKDAAKIYEKIIYMAKKHYSNNESYRLFSYGYMPINEQCIIKSLVILMEKFTNYNEIDDKENINFIINIEDIDLFQKCITGEQSASLMYINHAPYGYYLHQCEKDNNYELFNKTSEYLYQCEKEEAKLWDKLMESVAKHDWSTAYEIIINNN